MGEFGIGQSVPREEDPYLLRGAGRYVDDVAELGQARAYALRSPHAHAGIRAVAVERAGALPGVQLILTGDHPEIRALGLQRPKYPRKRRDGSPAFIAAQPLLARERVRYIGDPSPSSSPTRCIRRRMRRKRSRSITSRCRRWSWPMPRCSRALRQYGSNAPTTRPSSTRRETKRRPRMRSAKPPTSCAIAW